MAELSKAAQNAKSAAMARKVAIRDARLAAINARNKAKRIEAWDKQQKAAGEENA